MKLLSQSSTQNWFHLGIPACTPCSAATSGRKVALKPAPRSSVNLITIPCTPTCPIQVNSTDMEREVRTHGAFTDGGAVYRMKDDVEHSLSLKTVTPTELEGPMPKKISMTKHP